MKILAIDTATEACSVALNIDGDVIERHTVEPRSHASQILPMVDELMSEAGLVLTSLDAIAFDRGPGSFTGIRIGTSVVQGLAFGAGLPVIPLSSLAILAEAAIAQALSENLIVMLDARMDEVYWACFKREQNTYVLCGEEQLSAPDKLELPAGEWTAFGTGWGAYKDILKQNSVIHWHSTSVDALPRAADLARLAAMEWQAQGGVEPNQALPVYLRHNVAMKQSERR